MKGESKQWDTRRKGHLKSEEELFEREVFIATYEFAVVGDLDCGWEADREEAEYRVTEYMEELAGWVRSQGGFTGSLKASVEEARQGSVLSMNMDNVEKAVYGGKRIEIRLTAVVFFVSGPALKEKMKELRQRILSVCEKSENSGKGGTKDE